MTLFDSGFNSGVKGGTGGCKAKQVQKGRSITGGSCLKSPKGKQEQPPNSVSYLLDSKFLLMYQE